MSGRPKLKQIAALYVETDGCYFGLDGVDPWDAERDAREYAGPHPVVAHPPCKRSSLIALEYFLLKSSAPRYRITLS